MPPPAPDRRLTESGIEVKPVYGPGDASGPARQPGAFPFTRGPYRDMDRGRPWTMRQYARFGSAEETNERFRTLLGRGQTGLSVAFDLPTQLGYDSDDAVAVGEVGRTGVAIDSVDDMARLLEGIPLDEVSTSMTINARAALVLLCSELVAAARCRVRAPRLRAGRRGARGARGGAARNGAERRAEGVRRARQLHLPATSVDAARARSVRVLGRAAPPP